MFWHFLDQSLPQSCTYLDRYCHNRERIYLSLEDSRGGGQVSNKDEDRTFHRRKLSDRLQNQSPLQPSWYSRYLQPETDESFSTKVLTTNDSIVLTRLKLKSGGSQEVIRKSTGWSIKILSIFQSFRPCPSKAPSDLVRMTNPFCITDITGVE